jgi:hypothetical protein
VKDSLLNLLVFLLVFLGVAALFIGYYSVALMLVPGGKGLVFANPWAGALLPALLGGLVVTLARSVHRPGKFRITWLLIAGAFLLLLTLPIPLFQQMAPVRAADAVPATPGRFLPLEDGSQLLTTPPTTVLIPTTDDPMTVSSLVQYDALNQRFVIPGQDPKPLGSTSPERAYFQYTPALISFQTDLLGLYSVLRDSVSANPLAFWARAWSITWLFLGLYFFFSLKTWPFVQIVVVLVAVRLALSFLVYAYWTVPALVDLWQSPAIAGWLRIWAPIVLVDVAAAALTSMTWLAKPHRQVALG